MTSPIGDRVSAAVRRAAILAAAALLAVAGLSFLVAAAWTALAARYDAVIASLVVGLALISPLTVLAVVGLVRAARAGSRPDAPPREGAFDDVIAAFGMGRAMGESLGRTTRRPPPEV